MKLRLVTAFCFCLLAVLHGYAQTPEKWTLEKCIDYAQVHNVNVGQAAITAQIAKNNHLQSKLNLLPSIDASISYDINFGNSLNPVTFAYVQANSQSASANIQANLPLFTGLQQVNAVQRAKYDLMASKYDYDAAKNNVALSVSSAFLQIVLNREIVDVLQKQEDLSKQQKATVESKVAAGALADNSLFEIDAQVARDEANLVNAKGVYDVSVLTLKQLLQLPDSVSMDLDVPQIDVENIEAIGTVSSEGIYNYALQNQPSITAADARVKSADINRKMAMGTFSPTLSMFTSLSTGYFSQDRSLVGFDTNFNPIYKDIPFKDQLKNDFRKVVGFQLSVPIFGKGQRFINLQNAKLQTQIRNLQLEGAKNSLRQDIEQAYVNAKAAAETYFANKKSYESAQKSLDALTKRFDNGLLGTFELQQAKNTLAAAESEMVKAKYTYVFRLKVLDFYQGKPITLSK